MNRRFRGPITLVLCLLVFIPQCIAVSNGARAAGNTETVAFRGNAQRTGQNPGPGPSHLRVRWWKGDASTRTADFYAPYAYSSGIAYGINGGLDATDAATGNVLWDLKVGEARGTLSKGNIFAVSGKAIMAVRAENGEVLWSFDPWAAVGDDERSSIGLTGPDMPYRFNNFWKSPIVASGRVIANAENNWLFALDPKSGRERWRFSTGELLGAPAARKGIVFAASADHHIYALDAKTGRTRWKLDINDDGYGVPAVADETVFIGGSHKLYAIDTTNGSIRWTADIGCCWHSSAIVAEGKVFVVGGDVLWALEITSGERVWAGKLTDREKGDTPNSPRPAPTYADGSIWVMSRDDLLIKIHAGDGVLQESMKFPPGWDWAIELETSTADSDSPLVVDGVIFVRDRGYIWVIE